jgi:hypothetical protein
VSGFDPAQIEVPRERRFVGFEAYREAMNCLRPGDVVILTAPVAFRWVHFAYAIERGLNEFMEKPISVDGPTTRRMLVLGEAQSNELLFQIRNYLGFFWASDGVFHDWARQWGGASPYYRQLHPSTGREEQLYKFKCKKYGLDPIRVRRPSGTFEMSGVAPGLCGAPRRGAGD